MGNIFAILSYLKRLISVKKCAGSKNQSSWSCL